jgi:hypothetical protein
METIEELKIENERLKKQLYEQKKRWESVCHNYLEYFTHGDESYIQTLCELYSFAVFRTELKKVFGNILSECKDPKLETGIGNDGVLYFYNEVDDDNFEQRYQEAIGTFIK